MTFEERLAATDLTPFKDNTSVKDDVFKLLLKQIYKYQKFKQSVILKKINRMSYGESTVKGYISSSMIYLKTGTKNFVLPKRGYDILDSFKVKHEAILTPPENEKCVIYKPREKAATPTPLEQPVEAPKYIEIAPPQYGVKCENMIRLFDTKEYCLGFIDCYKTVGDGKPVELVKVDFEVV